MYVVGIDGGGTKTRVAVCDAAGAILRRETLGAFNLSDIGEDGFRRRRSVRPPRRRFSRSIPTRSPR